MISKPRWYDMLPGHLKPEREAIKRLEELRTYYGLTDDDIVTGISISDWAAIKMAEIMIEKLRSESSIKEEKDHWRVIINYYYQGIINYHYKGIPPKSMIEKGKELDDIIMRMDSWENVIKFIISLKRENMDHDISGIQEQIDSTLYGYNWT